MKIKKGFNACLVLIASVFYLHTHAQVTTATMSGTVTSADGKPLAGATVKISFANAGINKTVVTQTDGSYVVPNLRVGGPYKISASYTGFQDKNEDNRSQAVHSNIAPARIRARRCPLRLFKKLWNRYGY